MAACLSGGWLRIMFSRNWLKYWKYNKKQRDDIIRIQFSKSDYIFDIFIHPIS
jgi:hypothetical protein